jgi:SsrA-binding protein
VAKARKTQAKRAAAKEAAQSGDRRVATNRRARHDYELIDTFECGIVLQGSEVKSLREGRAQIADAYARVADGELWLFGLHIPPWHFATGFGAHDPDRRRKLLVHRRQIDELFGQTTQQPLTLIPLSIYFRDGNAKVELALARGRKLHDKRQATLAREATREAERAARNAGRYSYD